MTPRKIELFVPAITPFLEDGTLDTPRFVAHAKALLNNGAHGLAPFGTTSEATSLTLTERMTALEALVDAGVSTNQLIPGTGCTSIADTVTLSAHATTLGCRGVLMLPPFYYKGVPEDGVYNFYAGVIEAVAETTPGLRVYLYHIPQMSGVPISLPLIERLLARYPNVIAGLKDSSGSWDNTKSVIEAFPTIDTYTASEALIPENVAAGGAGCISASSNVNASGIRRLIDGLGSADEADLHKQVSGVRKIFESLPLIPSIKAAVAVQKGDFAYAIVRPPFVALDTDTDTPNGAAIAEAVRLAGRQE
ncbi:dihydrodipicolinate synthase family protein [Falsihalocynthiibacter sp. BN13B15]|uniref:dihydrodipicolinate synthase family protein n=1 Tax=Falsihalocynthiibacter sp. BN13B15 TaxID=3240871 RepID=UPI00350F1F36